MVKPIKLVDPSGEILGAVILPEQATEELLVCGINIHLYVSNPVRVFSPPNEVDPVEHIALVPAPMRNDAVMLVAGTLWALEKIPGCFFIPGYAFSQKRV